MNILEVEKINLIFNDEKGQNIIKIIITEEDDILLTHKGVIKLINEHEIYYSLKKLMEDSS